VKDYMSFVLVKKCDSRLQAELLKAFLESEGIEAFVQADDAGGMLPSLSDLGGVSLYVPSKDQERAQEILFKHQQI
jgi:hypothetical protein